MNNKRHNTTPDRHDERAKGYPETDRPTGLSACGKADKPAAQHGRISGSGNSAPLLTAEEAAFLLRDRQTPRSLEYHSVILELHEIDRRLTPSTSVGDDIFPFMMGLLPVLGNQIQRAAFPL